ncbi:hypothetical protein Tco_1367415 [Tanacetum coccineum]
MALSIADQIALDDALVAPADRLRIGKCNLRLSSDVTSKEATLQVLLMALSIADQIALDDALVAPADRLKIGKCNLRLSSDVTSKEATLQVVYDVLKITPFYKAFQVTADAPEIYMQEFWASAYVHNRSVRFKMNNKKHIIGLEQFRDILQICPKVGNKKFVDPPLEKEILIFLASLGHSGDIRKLTDVNVNKLHQPWRSFAAVINKCLSGTPSYDSLIHEKILKKMIQLKYQVYKATTEKLDWINPEGSQYSHDLRQPLPLVPNSQGHRVIPFHHFINNDLEYLRGGVSSRKYSTSVTKTTAADYGHIKWIEDLVPNSMWSLYKALVEAYEADKILLDTYGDTVTIKRPRDGADDDQEPSVGTDRGSKRRRQSAPVGESMHSLDVFKGPADQEFETGVQDEQAEEEYGNSPREGLHPSRRPSMKLEQRDTPCASLKVVFSFVLTQVNMDNPNITMEEYIRLEEEKARRRAIVFNGTLTSEAALLREPTVSSLNNDEIDFRISFDEFDDEDCTPTVSYIDDLDFFKDFENEFPAIVYNDALTSKSDFLTKPIDNNDDRIDIKQFSRGPHEGKSTNVGGEYTNLEILKC